MVETAKSKKLIVLGVDAMDPRLTRKFIDEGIMPNTKLIAERGAQRHDFVMLGGHPTVTPPMWTTLACGCYANVHGITGFFRQSKKSLDMSSYNLNSRLCTAEPIWNTLVEAGYKTLVWHWPGSSWPPTSDNPNLFVVDGTNPGSVGAAVCGIEGPFMAVANDKIEAVTYHTKMASEAMAPCVIEDLDLEKSDALAKAEMQSSGPIATDGSDTFIGSGDNEEGSGDMHHLIVRPSQMTTAITEEKVDVSVSPIKDAKGWNAAPADAKEFTILFSGGLVRRPALVLKDESGEYKKVAIYKNKKENEPIVVLEVGVLAQDVVDEAIKNNVHYTVNRNLKLLKLTPEGDDLAIFVSNSMDINNDSVWHPKRLYKEIVENVGYQKPSVVLGCQDETLITDCMLDNWYAVADWQSASILHLIDNENLDMVMSHFHNVDAEAHMFIKHLAKRPDNRKPQEVYEKFIRDLYIQTDYYLGKFVHLLDEGWTIMVTSDHAQVAPKYGQQMIGDGCGCVIPGLRDLGYTVMKKDENGNDIDEIDWSKTRAVANREMNIYINLKGRDPHGIVDPADKYELEEQIMTDLYGLKHPESGKRMISLALRNRDAVVIGYGGPECGDIIYTMAEGYNYDHNDCLSTTLGESDTSISPIFIAAGPGIKEGYETDRVIRQVDMAPTIAVLTGARMPAQCEGAPIYQILEK